MRATSRPLRVVQVGFHVAFGSHVMSAGAHSHAPHSLSSTMVTAHLLAALVAALLLRRAESWCWQLTALLCRSVQVVRAVATVTAPDVVLMPMRAWDGQVRSLRSLLLAAAQPRRGPPALRSS